MFKIDVRDADGKITNSTVIADGSGEPDSIASKSETLYDSEIAPELTKLATRCHENDMGFLAAVSYNTDNGKDYGSTKYLVENDRFAMQMVRFAMLANGNIDRFLIDVERYANEHNINLREESIYFKLMKRIES